MRWLTRIESYSMANIFGGESLSATAAATSRTSVRLKHQQEHQEVVGGLQLSKETRHDRRRLLFMLNSLVKKRVTNNLLMRPSLLLFALILPVACFCCGAQFTTSHQPAQKPSKAHHTVTISTSSANLRTTPVTTPASISSVIKITQSTKFPEDLENKDIESLSKLIQTGHYRHVRIPFTPLALTSVSIMAQNSSQQHRYVTNGSRRELGAKTLDLLGGPSHDEVVELSESTHRFNLGSDDDDIDDDDDNHSANQSNIDFAFTDAQAVPPTVLVPLLQPIRATKLHPNLVINANQFEQQTEIDPPGLNAVTPEGKNENEHRVQSDQFTLKKPGATLDYNYTEGSRDSLDKCCNLAHSTTTTIGYNAGDKSKSRILITGRTSRDRLEQQFRETAPTVSSNKSLARHWTNDSHNLIVSLSSDKIPTNRRKHAVKHTHEFSEYDDLFLMNDFRPDRLSSPNSLAVRHKRSSRAIGGGADGFSPDEVSRQVQKIYFGGFFPWLADEKTQNSLGRSDQQDSKLNNLPTSQTGKQQLNTETRHQLGKFILPAVRLALDHINTNRTILSAYKLEVVPRDTQCNATISLKQFFDMVYEEPKKMLLYGDACRVSTDPIAKASYFFDLIQISYADTDPIYTIENYPNFFRVVPSENALSLARIPFIRHFNWTRVGTIYQNLPRYSLPHSKLLTDLERFQIVIKQSVSLPGSVDGLENRYLGDELRKLKDKDVRIILGNFDEEWALLLFCEAYREKMIGRKYQWLLTGFSETKLWQFYDTKGCSCTKQELLIAMDGYIITDITPVTRSQHRTISGMMAHEYLDEYRRRAREMNISIAENKFYGYVYDGIWAIALALNRVDSLLKYYNKLAREGKVKLKPQLESIGSLLDFEYHQPIWVKLIRDALNKTRFDGVTGTVSFHKNERPGLITFSQFQAFRDMNEVIIGSYDALRDQLDLNVGFPIIWRGSSPPIDYTIQRVTPFRINRTLFVIISILALLGIILACIFLFVNIKFRNQRYIKMSSPYLNNLIIIGCILTFTSVIILGLDSGLTSEYNFPYICNARAWVLMAGFTLAFGSMFSKTFRVHSIFTNIKLHKKVIKDYKLFMVVFILLTFDVCILIVWQYFDPFYRETNNGTSLQDPDNEDIIIVPEMEHCQSKRMTIFLSVIYIYKGLLMAFGCFLAWETRHVSIPALNDSKYIGLSVYNVVIMCVIGASLSFILRDQQDASFVIISIFIIFCSTTTLCLVFVPKIIELKQNPRAGDHRVRATLKTFKKNYHEEALGAAAAAGCRDMYGNPIGRGYGMNLNDRIKLLVDENVKHRSLLKEKTYELEALTSKYRKIQSMVQSGQFLQAINTSGPTGLQLIAATGTGAGAAAAAGCSASSATIGATLGLSGQSLRPMRPTHHTGAGTGGSGGGGASSMLLGVGASGAGGSVSMNTLHQQPVATGTSSGGASSSSTQVTALLLTSRSSTTARDRVSFSATASGGGGGKCDQTSTAPAATSSNPARLLTSRGSLGKLANGGSNNGASDRLAAHSSTSLTAGKQQTSINDCATDRFYLDEQEQREQQRHQRQHCCNHQCQHSSGGLRSSPFMSSATQLTITNTTSSTNNATDLTIDYSSSNRLISTATTSSTGCSSNVPAPNSISPPVNVDELGECVHKIARQVAEAAKQPTRPTKTEAGLDKDNAAAAAAATTVCDRHHQQVFSYTITTDKQKRQQEQQLVSSIEANERCLDAPNTVAQPRQDMNLFSMLSHKSSSNNNNNKGKESDRHLHQTTSRQKIAHWTGDKRDELCHWLGGPFCTVMLRQAGSLDNWKQQQQQVHENSQQSALACPATLTSGGGGGVQACKRASSQIGASSDLVSGAGRTMAPAKTTLVNSSRHKLPRTLSMIEYLGLNELDLIARRHDKIFQNNNNSNNKCTYQEQEQARHNHSRRRLLNCCASCECCLLASATHQTNFVHKSQRQATGHRRSSPAATIGAAAQQISHTGSQVVCSSSSRQQQQQQQQHEPLHLYRMSEGNIAAFSSSDPYNSDDLLNTTSLISCSTCCSLASQTYGSHSNIYYDEHEFILSISTHSSDDSSQSPHHHHHHHHHHEHNDFNSSSSQTISSSLSQSSSIVIGGGNASQQQQQQQQQQRAQSLYGSQSESAASLSLSQSSLVLNQSSGVASCPHSNSRRHQHNSNNNNNQQHHHRQDKCQQQFHTKGQPVHQHTHQQHPMTSTATTLKNNTDNNCQQLSMQQTSQGPQRDRLAATAMSHPLAPPPPPPPPLPPSPIDADDKTEQESSLCTSGVLYGPPNSKEGANDSAQLAASDSAGLIKASTMFGAASIINDENAFDELLSDAEGEPSGSVTIKCDILENL